MKFVTALFALSLASVSVFAAPSPKHFACDGVGGVDEYRVAISLVENKASFFDNDSTSYMKLKSTVVLESLPPQTQMTFEGKEKSFAGTLKLIFNLTRKNISLYSIDTKGKSSKVGDAKCINVPAWPRGDF